jgi:hypothetical protein
VFRVRRLALASLLASVVAAAAIAVVVMPAATAHSGTAAAPVTAANPAKVTVGVTVLHFNAKGRRSAATGLVTAKLTTSTGAQKTVRTTVAITAAATGNCRILHLVLNQLNLVLLGVTVHLDKVVLNITGQPNGGVLGSLFCALANSKLAATRASAAHQLNIRIARGGQRLVGLNSYFTAQAAPAAGATCPILDLTIGPLHLNLLGLVVNLNQVHLTVTATQGAGVLGDLLCSLSTTTPPAARPAG